TPAMRPSIFAALTAMSLASLAADFPAPEQLPAQPALPDPLTLWDGGKITTPEEWRQQRVPELRALFAHYMYGRWPGILQPVTGQVLRTDPAAFGGKATLKEVAVSMGLEQPVHLLIVVPNHRKQAAPCFLGLNFSGNYALVADRLV